MFSAKDIMTNQVPILSKDLSVVEAYKIMKEYEYSNFPVVDSGGSYSGILTKEDVHSVLYLSSGKTFLDHVKIDRLVNSERLVCGLELPMPDVILLFLSKQTDCLPVLREEKIAGVITPVSLLKAYQKNAGFYYKDTARQEAFV